MSMMYSLLSLNSISSAYKLDLLYRFDTLFPREYRIIWISPAYSYPSTKLIVIFAVEESSSKSMYDEKSTRHTQVSYSSRFFSNDISPGS